MRSPFFRLAWSVLLLVIAQSSATALGSDSYPIEESNPYAGFRKFVSRSQLGTFEGVDDNGRPCFVTASLGPNDLTFRGIGRVLIRPGNRIRLGEVEYRVLNSRGQKMSGKVENDHLEAGYEIVENRRRQSYYLELDRSSAGELISLSYSEAYQIGHDITRTEFECGRLTR